MILFAYGVLVAACASSPSGGSAARDQSGAEPPDHGVHRKIRAVDNHAHANSVMPGDSDADAFRWTALRRSSYPYGFSLTAWTPTRPRRGSGACVRRLTL
jgi:hypothetical protein